VTKGYFGDASATRETFAADRWLKSGDLGYFDSDEYFHLTGRLKELIKVYAWAVVSAELETLLATHPAVADVAVIGGAHAKSGEIPVAYIVPRLPIEANELMNWAAAQVASYKRIRAVAFVAQIPRSSAIKSLPSIDRAAMIDDPRLGLVLNHSSANERTVIQASQ
jgi:acyl-CoA synthetase (AMP-forming)/AMP-acid ligase II